MQPCGYLILGKRKAPARLHQITFLVEQLGAVFSPSRTGPSLLGPAGLLVYGQVSPFAARTSSMGAASRGS